MKKRIVRGSTPSPAMKDLHYSVHRLPRSFGQREVATVFSSCPVNGSLPLHGIVTFQRLQPWEPSTSSNTTQTSGCCGGGGGGDSRGCMIDFTHDAAEFKDEARERFFAFVEGLRRRLNELCTTTEDPESCKKDWWIDCVDPATGLAASGECGPCAYSETDGIEQLLAYEMVHVGTLGGGCRMVSHPEWGLDVYPATIFASCPTEILLSALDTMPVLDPLN